MLETQLGVRVSEFLGCMVPGECLELDRAHVFPVSHVLFFFFLLKGSCSKGAGSCSL